jgi:hypothetical protein
MSVHLDRESRDAFTSAMRALERVVDARPLSRGPTPLDPSRRTRTDDPNR